MFYLTYIFAELRRRSGRTILTALGLGVGVGLVVAVSALSSGLDRAQAQVLEPLTGVGTDMTVSRPIDFSPPDAGGGFPQLSDEERRQLEQENGGARLGLRGLGNAWREVLQGQLRLYRTAVVLGPGSRQDRRSGWSHGGCGRVDAQRGARGGNGPDRAVPAASKGSQNGGGPAGPPDNIDFASISVSGVDERHEELGAITSGQVTSGRYFGSTEAREAILNESYASREGIEVGDTIPLHGKKFKVVGIAKTPLGGQSSDVYLKLAQLQKLADRSGRVNTVYVRADSADQVAAISSKIEKTVDGASVTTAEDLAARVSGTLTDAKNLAGSLGTALEVVGLLGAFLIASLLTLSSVTKRIRELGTLKALGWSQRLVIRQVTGESLVQGVLGGLVGVVLGLAGAVAISALAPSLEATVGDAAADAGPRFIGPFGQGAVNSATTDVSLGAPVSIGLVAAAVGLAVLGGLIAGAVGSARVARLRPADALRHVD